jgi:uncharacterized protein YjiS (DUF1127 family)
VAIRATIRVTTPARPWRAIEAPSVADELRVRRDMRQLRAMDDYMLKDIGLTRADIGSAVRYGRD